MAPQASGNQWGRVHPARHLQAQRPRCAGTAGLALGGEAAAAASWYTKSKRTVPDSRKTSYCEDTASIMENRKQLPAKAEEIDKIQCKCDDSTLWRRQISLQLLPENKQELICLGCGWRRFL